VTGALPVGHLARIEGLPGRWQVWSKSSESPGAHYFVPYDDDAREANVKIAVARVIFRRHSPRPEITLLRTERNRP
jgi:hypothetical protein